MLLDSELNVLIHELDLSLQRGQFLKSDQNNDPVPSSLEELNENWIKKVRSRAVSQLGQDIWILEKCSYKRGGFFVEFGATNGIILSNTYLLEKDFGWNGICSEPNPEFLNLLKKNRLCVVSDECIGSSTGEKVEFIFADVYGGAVADMDKDEHREKREAYRASGATGQLTTISLHDFLLKHNAPKTIDYLSVDTEGSEFAILSAFPFSEWDVRHITVEHNNTPQRQQIRDLLSSHGYQCQEAQWDDWYYRT
jgi:FkbM family methyltransferase